MRQRHFLVATLMLIFGLVWVANAFGDPIVIFNTGQTAGGPALPVGTLDTHYTLIAAPAGVPLTAIATSTIPAWTANTPTADWISPGSSGDTIWPVGNYDFRTTFSLSGLNPSSAQLSGLWTADNNACFSLNGVVTTACVGFDAFSSLHPFSITSGFISGINTLDLVVFNGGGPVGTIVEISGTASPLSSTVPEPSSLMLIGTGLLAMCGTVRRKLAGP
jgi:hypothetical protein